jgi:hypothetical protein
MVYKLRFVQTFDKRNEESFWFWERKFMELEEKTPELKVGKRYAPVMGRDATNTMVWEAEYDSLEEATHVLALLENNDEHDELLSRQIVYMRDAYVELYRQII